MTWAWGRRGGLVWGYGDRIRGHSTLLCQLLIPTPHPALQLVAAIMLVYCRDVLEAEIKISSPNSFRNPSVWAPHKWHIFGGKLVSQAHHLSPSMFTFSFNSPVFDRIQKQGADDACEQSCCRGLSEMLWQENREVFCSPWLAASCGIAASQAERTRQS